MRRITELCKPEVNNVRNTGIVDENVRRFEIAMNHAAKMGGLHGFSNSHKEHGHFALRRFRLRHKEVDRPAFDVVHDEIIEPANTAAVMDRDDRRMAKLRENLDFTAQPSLFRDRADFAVTQELNGHVTAGRLLECLVDDALPPAMQFSDKFVAGRCGNMAWDTRMHTMTRATD